MNAQIINLGAPKCCSSEQRCGRAGSACSGQLPSKIANMYYECYNENSIDTKIPMQTSVSSALPVVTIYADGAAKGNGTKSAKGGWGYLAEFADGRKLESFGGESPTTNNRMELMAVIRALTELPEKHNVTLFTDSQYVVKGMSEWLPGWKRRGWKTAGGEPVKNVELWQALETISGSHLVSWQWVRGHNGHPGNERADELANMGVVR